MKVYRALPPAVATFYEKQSDVPRGIKFEAVEFPFNASPKGDFVAWLNVATQPPVAVIEDDCDGADDGADWGWFHRLPLPAPCPCLPAHFRSDRMNDQATLRQFATAVDALRPVPLSGIEEALADEAMLALSKLRDRLVCRDANHAACRIDEAIERVEAVARGRVVGIDPNLIDLPSAVREGQD